MMSTGNTAGSAAAADQPPETQLSRWSMVTMVSVLLGLAAAGIMTAAMFWIGDYYRGAQFNRDEEADRSCKSCSPRRRMSCKPTGGLIGSKVWFGYRSTRRYSC